MKKRSLLSIIFFTALLCGVLSLFRAETHAAVSEVVEKDGIRYRYLEAEDAYEIYHVSYIDHVNDHRVTIPEKVNGKPVVAVGKEAGRIWLSTI